MFARRVVGESMSPGLNPGDIVVARRKAVRVGDIVIAKQKGREVIKRVSGISDGEVKLTGDNREKSTDSRHYGTVKNGAILGVVMIHFPSAVTPPKSRTPQAHIFAAAAGMVMTVFALVHLFRIDTLLPLLDKVLPGGEGFASLLGASLVTIEVFAVPYLFRMKLSPLGHIASGLFALLAPLIWLWIAIWAYGLNQSIGLLGQFVATPSNLLVLFASAAWVGLNSYVLWLTRYDTLFGRLSK